MITDVPFHIDDRPTTNGKLNPEPIRGRRRHPEGKQQCDYHHHEDTRKYDSTTFEHFQVTRRDTTTLFARALQALTFSFLLAPVISLLFLLQTLKPATILATRR